MTTQPFWHGFSERTPAGAHGHPLPFALVGGAETLIGHGERAALDKGPLETLSERVARFFEDQAEGPDVLVGAVPFSRDESAHLVQPRQVMRIQGRFDPHDVLELSSVRDRTPQTSGQCRIAGEPDADGYAHSVDAGLEAIASSAGALRKIVLSRSLVVRAEHPFDLRMLFARLAGDESITTFAAPLPARDGAPRTLIGATPELLVEKRGLRVLSHPLAGSAPRRTDKGADEASAKALMASGKDHREHALVVEAILDTLAPFCRDLATPEGTCLRATASLWHLGTRIEGRLKDAAISSADLVAALHPTPAVCGEPRAEAAAAIDRLEGYDRDFYAGAVGWCNAAGDGRWSVSIRCAEICGRTARLYAGAGIVPGSDPASETNETSVKFKAMLAALGIAEPGRGPERREGQGEAAR
ncbi:isochorismate synthase [Breoghania corrubedonensis]|uniref:isochorismate synthase n=1 Tax=Breoghania corrubedonensis TaxID=665038 RepID=A0A2T5V6K6_9HYPH|nr:isochorismate synthase [Breoghania corrubedonensis]PTW59381.1 isochorismate synthase [Breoghania corrubedonensis]